MPPRVGIPVCTVVYMPPWGYSRVKGSREPLYLHPFHCWAIPEPPFSLPVSLLGYTWASSLLYPFHCWAIPEPLPFHPFHCWARNKAPSTRFTVGLERPALRPCSFPFHCWSCSLLFPVSLLDTRPHTVNTRFTVGETPVPGRLIPHNWDILDN